MLNLLLASNSLGQEKSMDQIFLSIEAENLDLKALFSRIEKATGFEFAYFKSAVDENLTINFSFKRESLGNILRQLSSKANLKFKRVNDKIYVNKKNGSAPEVQEVFETQPSQTRTITGKVTSSEDGEGLPGVNVVEKGTTNGTVTDVQGSFTLEVSEMATLVFSSVGYTQEEVEVGNRSVIDLTMTTDVQQLKELVVVGYGVQQRRDVTGSVASIPSEYIEDIPVSNFSEALTGQVAGVQVQQTTGAPGGGLSIRVRGTGSISAGNEPLYVIDGYPVSNNAEIGSQGSPDQNINPLSSLNPNDIESIEVLKDASAAAIYGSRGANGVVLITTKGGKKGTPQIQFNAYYGSQEVTKTVDMLDAYQFAEFAKDAFNNAWVDRGGNANDPNDLRPDGERLRVPPEFLNPDLLQANTDFQDAIFTTAPVQNYQVSVSGGSDVARYFVSGGYFNQSGIVKNSGFERYSARANIDVDISEKFKLGLNLTPSFSINDLASAEGHWASNGAINAALAIMPIFPLRTPDGGYGSQVDFGYGMPTISSPYGIVNEYMGELEQLRLLGNIFLEYEIWNGLTFKTSIGTDINNYNTNTYSPTIIDRRGGPSVGTYNTANEINWLNENTLNFNRVINNDHAIGALIGMTVQKERWESSFIEATNFPNDRITTLNAGQVTGGNSQVEAWSLLSFLGRTNYAYKDKYLLTATIRTDGSSRFGSENRWGVFPSASVGWRLSEEAFLQDIDPVSDLKLRVSYGITGNNFIANYGAIGLLQSENYVFGNGTGNLNNGLGQSTISNKDLGWETTKQLDIGLELGLFDDRIFFVADYYLSNTSDLLLNVPVPTSTGFNTSLQNIGEVQNKGWEFAINTKNTTGNFKWSTNANISFNRNEVLALGPESDPIRSGSGIGNTHITVIGEPMGNFYGYIQEGVFIDAEDLANSPSFSTSMPGDVKYKDVNEDGAITPDDRTIIGNNRPDFVWGMTNTFFYRNFELNVIMQGVQGNEILNLSSRFISNLEGNQNQRIEVLDRWKSPQEPGNGIIPRASSRTTGNNNNVSTRWIEDGSFIRIRNITLNYNLPNNLLENIFIKSGRIYFGVQNALTFTDYKGYNPEVNLQGGAALTPGTDYGGYPLSRTYILGLNFNF
ncbi:MAG: SusC/RagA family TonB-linked outer membrane protein [Candidatus Cyclobacteriaceae bacterium M3_2C_046]